MTRRTWLLVLAGLILVGLPVAGRWARSGAPPGCALDGTRVDPRYRVVVEGAGGTHQFCGVRCAQLWIGKQRGGVRSVRVTDEESGALVPAGSAYYVRSGVVTNHVTRNRTHAFARESAARRHAEVYRGTVLRGPDAPLATRPD